MVVDQLESKVKGELMSRAHALGADLNQYGPMIEKACQCFAALAERKIFNDDVPQEDVDTFEAILLNLASAGAALAVREVKQVCKDIAEELWAFMLNAVKELVL